MYLLHKLPTFINSPHNFQKFLRMHPLKCYLIYKAYNVNERLSIVACRTCQLSYLLIGLVSILQLNHMTNLGFNSFQSLVTQLKSN